MSKKGPKVKEVAREVGITSRQLIDRCRAEGIPVQNSVTRVDPDVVRAIRAWFGPDRTRQGEGLRHVDDPP